MRRAVWALMVLGALAPACETVPRPQPLVPSPPAGDAKLLALQQEREQLLTTLGEFHDRIRDLESKLGDRQNQPAAASYDQLLNAKDAELAELRRLTPEHDKLVSQLAMANNELLQARQRIGSLEQQLATREKDLATLQTRTTALSDLEVARRRIMDLEAQVARQDHDLRTVKSENAERDSLSVQLQTATATIESLKARISALDQQLRDREHAFETVRSRLTERDKLVPQYNAMIAEIYQARHRIAALEQRLNEKTRDLSPRQKSAQAPMTPREAGTTSNKNAGSSEKDTGRAGGPPPTSSTQSTAREASFAAMKEEILKVLPSDSGQKAITVKQEGSRLTIALASNWLFASGEAALTPEGMTMLKRIGTVLGPLSDKFVHVAGHTDNQALSKTLQKTFSDNKALSWARAENARRALVTGGMSAERTKAVGLADSRPIASNATEQGRQKNRRLELVIVQGPTVASTTGKPTDDRDRLAALAPSY
ncbi:MAG: Flagellar motor rotation protein MotB [Nitrospira sp.]|nr:OmpA family protein [Nitrospira sp.]ULA59587.1 MAG: Flagellar motor rotation protein MotB [Nitrospira sp.]